MYQTLLGDAKFFEFLLRLDEDSAREIQAGGCECGGRLHQAHYPRKPRGGPEVLSRWVSRRLSYCCSVDGCRRRCTPPSLRFLGRKVFFSLVVLLVPALREGPTPIRVRRLQELFGVSARTLRRWQRFWRFEFGHSEAMKRLRGLSAVPLESGRLPTCLLEIFGCSPEAESVDTKPRLVAVLRALSPAKRDVQILCG